MKEKLCQMNTEYAGRPTTTITLEIPTELLEYVEKTTALEGSDTGTIINCFIQQGLLNSRATIKRLEFAEHAKDVLQKQGIHQSAINEIFNKLLF
jgi:hypothetical protein